MKTTLFGVPDGATGLAIAEIAKTAPKLVFVARDDARLQAVEASLGYFAPHLEVVSLPAWDCQPYDRVSPNGEIVSRRVAVLSRLADAEDDRLVLLTTVNGILQRLPPRDFLRGSALDLAPGDSYPIDKLVGFLEGNGYIRTGTVREPGEYAVRGGILDVFPSGEETPLRLDFFGDELETVRAFDPATQRSIGSHERLRFLPVGEFVLDEPAIERFRKGYRGLFGGDVSKDLLYEAVTAGRRHPGMEHWLSLYHERLETLSDYLPGAVMVLDDQSEEATTARHGLINDYHQTRHDMVGTDAGNPYRPVAPEALYLSEDEWAAALVEHQATRFSSFAGDDASFRDFGARAGLSFAEVRSVPGANIYAEVGTALAREVEAGRKVLITGYTEGSRSRLAAVMVDHGVSSLEGAGGPDDLASGQVVTSVLPIERGFRRDDLLVVTEQDILGERMVRPSRRRRRAEDFLREVSALDTGDYVVHSEHGIGQYDGLETLDVDGAPHDCLRVLYLGGDRLFVPVEDIEILSRYGSEESGAVLDKLGGAAWQARKARVKKRIRDMADELIKTAAARELRRSEPLATPAGAYDEFCARFPFAETDDQLRAIEEVLGDLASGKPMDRLVCGDVGFGKTEVALRATLVTAMQGYQVAIVVPTTLLSRQHFQVFADRFKGLPLKVRQLSRLVSTKDANAIREELASGECNIVIGTHALLAKSISFDNLGLLVVDEEQHFGVGQKERLKALRAEVHVLTLTATPIPRTLQLALTGVREMSLITTPPVDRLAVRTFVLPYDGMVIREALLREHYRGGQSFYVCPRIEDLGRVYDRLSKLCPELRIGSAHGRLPPAELEDMMTRFCDGGFDVLLSTNIIESGLDIPNANTIIMHRSDMFGLAQLYQLRGRVGRSKTRAYAYLTTNPSKVLTPMARRRLEVLQTLDSLGAGFSLASHDMDIRGAGNLLGEEQSGQVREVGIELYQELLREAVAEAQEAGPDGDGGAAAASSSWSPQITVGMPVLIPEPYVADLGVRLSLYRRIASLEDKAETESFAAELTDRFGPVPAEVENLLSIIAVKRLCKVANVEKVDSGPKGAVVTFRNNDFANPAGLVMLLSKQRGTLQLRPDHKLVRKAAWGRPAERLAGLQSFMRELADIAVG